MTLEQIRAALPTHIMLTPGVHRWKDGDDFYAKGLPRIYPDSWYEAGQNDDDKFGMPVLYSQIGRRPIPPHILDNHAFWVLLERICYLSPPMSAEFCHAKWLVNRDLDLFKSDIKRLGGVQRIERNFIMGRLYDKWLLEQMGGV